VQQKQQDTIKLVVSSYFPISNRAFEKFIQLFHIKQLAAHEIFIEAGFKDLSEYFILEGLIRGFVTTARGDEVTLSFFYDKSILTPFSARTQKSISALNYQALSDCEVAYINAQEFAQKVIELELLKKTRKEISLVSLSAKERLLQFRNDFPSFENLFSHAHIASYLGITPVSLSRIRCEEYSNCRGYNYCGFDNFDYKIFSGFLKPGRFDRG